MPVTPSATAPAPYAEIDWDDAGRPTSRVYGDVYFSRDDGAVETEYVFLNQNRLPERFAALPDDSDFVIGETGFGTGLNLLCAWQLFERVAPTSARLHFVSVEKHPLSPSDLARALALWPAFAALSGQLLAQYVAVHAGFQQFILAEGRVTLTLLIGDALTQLPTLDAPIDAWFLDGFAPAKNPDMWTPALFSELARLSRPGTTLATFTTTGWVRRALVEVGFALRKVPGLGKKWEVMGGAFQGSAAPAGAPWYDRPPRDDRPHEALVIGAGLAGTATAASLAARGYRVTVLERHAAAAQEASGNPQGVLYLKLSAHHTALSQLIVSGFGYTRRRLTALTTGEDWSPCGVLQLAFDDQEAGRQAKLAAAFDPSLLRAIDGDEATRLAGVELQCGGLYYPGAGWVHPPALCRQQLDHPGIRLLTHHEVLELRRCKGVWQAWSGERLLASAPQVVLAGAAEVRRFAGAADLPLKRIRGQVTRLPLTPASQALATVVCADGYVAPARAGEHTLGASFDFHSQDLVPTTAEHASNLTLLAGISSDLVQRLSADTLDPATLQGRAAWRCTSPDYLPIVGPLADPEAFRTAYAVLGKDARQVPETPCPWLPGLFVNTGHGSRGLITAPLCGELVAAWMSGTPLPVPRPVADACHPNRFMLRALVRGQP